MANRHYLDVPYSDNEKAKEAGAKFDFKAKAWYVPKGMSLADFPQWKPEEIDPPEIQFAEALRQNGLKLDGEPVMDGRWHRVQVEGDARRERAGSYRGFLNQDVPAGNISNFKLGTSETWTASMPKQIARGLERPDQEATKARQAAAKERMQDAKDVLDAEQQKAARKARGIWKGLNEWANAGNNEYLNKKGVKGYGLKLDGKGNAVVPLRDNAGRIHSLQFINADSEKLFLKNGVVEGHYHVIDPKKIIDKSPNIQIAEGYATGATVYEASKQPVIIAFNKGNLAAVARAVQARYPEANLSIAADFDHKLDKDHERGLLAGFHKALETAAVTGAKVHLPRFSQTEKLNGLTDFNDLQQARGIEAVRTSLSGSVSMIVEQSLKKKQRLGGDKGMTR